MLCHQWRGRGEKANNIDREPNCVTQCSHSTLLFGYLISYLSWYRLDVRQTTYSYGVVRKTEREPNRMKREGRRLKSINHSRSDRFDISLGPQDERQWSSGCFVTHAGRSIVIIVLVSSASLRLIYDVRESNRLAEICVLVIRHARITSCYWDAVKRNIRFLRGVGGAWF